MKKHSISIQINAQEMEGDSREVEKAVEAMVSGKEQQSALEKLEMHTQKQQKVKKELLDALNTWAKPLDKELNSVKNPQQRAAITKYLKLLDKKITSNTDKDKEDILYASFEQNIGVLAKLAGGHYLS